MHENICQYEIPTRIVVFPRVKDALPFVSLFLKTLPRETVQGFILNPSYWITGYVLNQNSKSWVRKEASIFTNLSNVGK